jgi:hypothetical protein
MGQWGAAGVVLMPSCACACPQYFVPVSDQLTTVAAACVLHAGISINATTSGQQQWWNMTSSQRANALAEAASATLRDSPAESRSEAAAVSAVTRLWQYYNHPDLLNQECRAAQATAVAVLLGLGLLCRVLVFVLVKYKVARKKQE